MKEAVGDEWGDPSKSAIHRPETALPVGKFYTCSGDFHDWHTLGQDLWTNSENILMDRYRKFKANAQAKRGRGKKGKGKAKWYLQRRCDTEVLDQHIVSWRSLESIRASEQRLFPWFPPVCLFISRSPPHKLLGRHWAKWEVRFLKCCSISTWSIQHAGVFDGR